MRQEGQEVHAERTEQLRRVELFASLKQRALERIASIAHEETHARETSIFQHGDVGDKVYLILEGKVRIVRQIPGLGEEALAVLGPGQVFGEMALLDESPRSADALCHDSCRLLAIAKEDLDDLLFQDKDLAYEVLWGTVHMLVERLRSTNDKLTLLGVSGRFS
jgi:CRP/FNR family transcriptional regulator, cyclic AMP receptor protein